ncbi:Mitochondrial carrier protein [Balamuthia mandrillaris]
MSAASAPAPRPFGLRDPSFYGKCMLGGVLACGLTHASVVSLDVAKCRAQAHAKSGRWPGALTAGLRKIAAEEGAAGLRVGWVPTLFGYGAQGLFKFGLNELFIDLYKNAIGGADKLDTQWKKMALWAAASGSAEIFADIALCPFEMTKVKMQVTLPGDAGAVGTRMLPAMGQMYANRADTKFPFGSLTPLWGRQVPYTMIKFVGFYMTAEWIYEQIHKHTGKAKNDLSKAAQLSITFASGYWAGIFCAIATQPMDNLVSMKGNPINRDKGWGEMAREMGVKNLFTKGLGTRVIMIGTLTGLQWWIYGTFKSIMGFGTQ